MPHRLIQVFCKNRGIGQSLMLALLVFSPTFGALAKVERKELPFPAAGSSLNTIVFHVQGIFRHENRLFQTLERQSYFIESPFFGVKATSEDSFGKSTDSTRVEIPPKLRIGSWQGGTVSNGKLILLDGYGLRTAVFNLEKYVYLSDRTFPWDAIKPARDRAGEPTAKETSELRSKFTAAFRRAENLRLSGIAPTPASWTDKKHQAYVVASRIAGFPILKLSCNTEDASTCVLERACFAEGIDSLPGTAVRGIAVSQKRNVLVLGDAEQHRLLVFKMNSCFHLPLISELKLPAKLKRLTSVHIDHEDNLWVSTDLPDDFHNSSVFTWSAADWSY